MFFDPNNDFKSFCNVQGTIVFIQRTQENDLIYGYILINMSRNAFAYYQAVNVTLFHYIFIIQMQFVMSIKSTFIKFYFLFKLLITTFNRHKRFSFVFKEYMLNLYIYIYQIYNLSISINIHYTLISKLISKQSIDFNLHFCGKVLHLEGKQLSFYFQ